MGGKPRVEDSTLKAIAEYKKSKELANQRVTWTELAQHFSVSMSTVSKALKMYGVTETEIAEAKESSETVESPFVYAPIDIYLGRVEYLPVEPVSEKEKISSLNMRVQCLGCAEYFPYPSPEWNIHRKNCYETERCPLCKQWFVKSLKTMHDNDCHVGVTEIEIKQEDAVKLGYSHYKREDFECGICHQLSEKWYQVSAIEKDLKGNWINVHDINEDQIQVPSYLKHENDDKFHLDYVEKEPENLLKDFGKQKAFSEQLALKEKMERALEKQAEETYVCEYCGRRLLKGTNDEKRKAHLLYEESIEKVARESLQQDLMARSEKIKSEKEKLKEKLLEEGKLISAGKMPAEKIPEIEKKPEPTLKGESAKAMGSLMAGLPYAPPKPESKPEEKLAEPLSTVRSTQVIEPLKARVSTTTLPPMGASKKQAEVVEIIADLGQWGELTIKKLGDKWVVVDEFGQPLSAEYIPWRRKKRV